MSGGWLESLSLLGCLLLTGFAVKLMDDYLDAEYDICRGQRTLAVKLGRATLPYALVATLLGAYLNLPVCIAVFLGSYAMGMLSAPREHLPTRIPAYVEIALAFALSCILVGWHTALWGLAMMAVLDWVDDLLDAGRDAESGQGNIALRLGRVETVFLTLTALCVAVVCDPYATALTFIAFITLVIVSEWTTTKLLDEVEETGGVDI